MLIGKKINLSLEEKFNLFINNRISNSYINEEGILINVFSSYDLINKELLNKGIDYKEKSIDYLILEIENLSAQAFREDFRKENREVWESNRTVSEQLNILRDCVLELAFFLNDYQYEKMNLTLKREFKNIRQFSSLLRKNKLTY